MRHHADVRVGDRAHARDHPSGAFELDDVRAAFLDEADRVADRLLVGDLVRAERQVADHERPLRAAGHRARQEDHLVERHRHGRLVAEHHHRRGVADEDQLDAGLVRKPARGRVVRGDHHDLVAARASSARARGAAASRLRASFGRVLMYPCLLPGGRCRSVACRRRARRRRAWGRRGRRPRRSRE